MTTEGHIDVSFSDIHSSDDQLLLSKQKVLHLEWSIEYDTGPAADDTFPGQLISCNLEGVDSHQVIRCVQVSFLSPYSELTQNPSRPIS